MDSTQLKDLALLALEDLKGQDILALDVTKLTSIADYMIICSARSNRHLHALVNNVIQEGKKQGIRPYKGHCDTSNEWALVDLGDVIVHVMLPSVRDYYALEKLWSHV